MPDLFRHFFESHFFESHAVRPLRRCHTAVVIQYVPSALFNRGRNVMTRSTTHHTLQRISWLTLAGASALLGACSMSDTRHGAGLPTLDGKAPLVIAHRGASGYVPEETLEAYARAIELGADVIEMDLVSTKDGVLVTRHDPNLAISTDVAKHPEFASRKKTLQVDGETQTGWFSNDFTLAEIRTLGAISTDAERPQQFNGMYKVPTFQEVVDLAKAQSVKTGRTIAVYPETKNPTYFRELGLPLEDKLIAIINAAGWNSKTAPVFVQSFEPGSLKYMKSKGLNTRLIQLIDGDGVDMKTGAVTFAVPSDRPYDWTKAGDKRFFDAMVTPAGLAEIKTYADGIGPWKRFIISVKGTMGADGKAIDVNGDGKVNDADATSTQATSLVADAHKAGLFVHPFTFRNESRRLAADYKGDAKNEYLAYYRVGVDGVFTDFTDTALAARTQFLKEAGR
jgi:glycerophosphoryl diester phosphodiesterase